MKRLAVSLLLVLSLVSVSFAQSLIGGRGAGMGGTGVAASKGLDAAYYNPACLMRSEVSVAQVETGLGAAYTDVTDLSNAISKANDPGQFVLDNYSKNLSFNGTVNGLIGANVRKVGLSVIPMLLASVNKPAFSVGANVNATGFYAGVLTLGHTFSVPFLPAALDVGANIKSINGIMGSASITANPADPTQGSGSQTTATGAGLGFDVGVLTSFDIPFVTNFAAGLVLRDVSTSYTMKPTTNTLTLDQTTGSIVKGPDTAQPDQTVTVDSTTAIGVAATIPVIGLEAAMDLEMTKNDGTNTHIGVSYGLLMNTIILRAGIASGQNLGLTTFGAEVDARFAKIALVTASDSKNSGLTHAYADITIGL
ncbi:MAG: hypothetical protein JW782_04750 [Candidatus Saganbacteria bacterium]|nr:hypothetical protein [Candidatus Saganbacteria bacterium]